MATHTVIAALSGLLLLMVFILTVGDASRALSVWLTGAAAGGAASLAIQSTPGAQRLMKRLIRA